MQVRLVVVDGPETGQSFTFHGADSFLVGRSPKAHLVLDPRADRYVSRAHCLIDIRPPRLIVNDLGSTNGTWVNGQRVQRAVVGQGDEIRVGRTRIRVLVSDDPPPAPVHTQPVIEVPRERRPDGGPPARPGEEAPPPRLACWTCERDLGERADRDGLAAELPDAIYLCEACTAAAAPSEPVADRLPGYAVLGELGRGGMGVVYKAVHELTRRVCAIKRIRPDHLDDERSFRLFEREMRIQAGLHHRHLVRVLDHACGAGRCDFAVEFMPGGDAGQLVSSVYQGPVEPRLAVRITLEVLAGLEALHARGYVHRDLKPANVLLSRPPRLGHGVAKITDYGLAKSFEDAGNSLFDLTRDGEAAGSLMFMPPEQILNYRYVQPPADVYAAGTTLYHLLTARYTLDLPAFEGGATVRPGGAGNPIEALIEGEPIPILQRRPDLPPAVARVVDGAVQKELSARIPTAASFRVLLEEAARGEGWL